MTAALSFENIINKLSPSEKVELIEQIWDTIDPKDVPMPEWHRNLIDDSIQQFEDDPNCGIPLSKVNREIKNKYEF